MGQVNPRQQRIDFWVGFTAWLAINGLLELIAFTIFVNSAVGAALLGGLLVTNVVGVIVLAVIRRHAAFRLLVAFATTFAMTVLEGVVSAATDFNPNARTITATTFLVFWLIPLAVGVVFTVRAFRRE